MSIIVSKKFVNKSQVEVTVSCQKRKLSRLFIAQSAYKNPDVFEDVVIPRMTTTIDEIISGCSEDICLCRKDWPNIRSVIFPRDFEVQTRILLNLENGDF